MGEVGAQCSCTKGAVSCSSLGERRSGQAGRREAVTSLPQVHPIHAVQDLWIELG